MMATGRIREVRSLGPLSQYCLQLRAHEKYEY
jgi:hypothetical protein